jgi:hypothetical protein
MRLLLLLLWAVPALASDSKLYTQADVDAAFREWQQLRAQEQRDLYEGFKGELLQREEVIHELKRKVESLTGRSVCS